MVAADIVEIDVDPLRAPRPSAASRSARPYSRSPRPRRASRTQAHFSAPPAEPITVMPLALAICTTAEPTAPAAAETKTMSPSFASRDAQQPEIGGAAGEAEIAEPLMVLDRQRRHLVERLGRPGRALRASRACGRRCRPPRNAASGSRPPCRPRRPASARRARTAARSISRRSSARAYRDRPRATCSRPGPSRPGARAAAPPSARNCPSSAAPRGATSDARRGSWS